MDKTPILQIIYSSTAAQPFSTQQIAELHEKSRVNNLALGITGLLVHHDGFFIQALEGPEAEVSALYEKISADPRHVEVRSLIRTLVQAKEFDGWAMGLIESKDAPENEGLILMERLKNVVAEKTYAKTLIRMFMEGYWRRKIR